jgi:probable rRNA maturation factor
MITIEPPRSNTTNADGWLAWGLSRPGLTRFANKAQAAAGLKGEVEILLTGDATLRRLNRDYRKKDKATDVLSFPAPEGFGDGHAGDLAISLQTAQRQADEHGHTLADEVRILLLHGLLHLAGMDHEVDAGEMAERESELRKQLKLPVGLIDRATEETTRIKTVPKLAKKPLKALKTASKNAQKSTRRVAA